MRFALLLQRAARENALAVTARDVLHLATLGGADAMGLSSQTGSLTPGKHADLIAVRLDQPHAIPATAPYAALIYSARASDVVLTLCGGETIYDTDVWPTLDKAAVYENCRAARKKLTL